MKVKLIRETDKPFFTNTEAVKYVAPSLEKYFRNIYAHQYDEEIGIKDNSAYFYTHQITGGDRRDALPVIDTPVSAGCILQSFYDAIGGPSSIEELEGLGYPYSKMYRLTLSGKSCGFFIKDHNVLIASDWTHSISNLPAIKAIVDNLIEHEILSPARRKPMKKLSIKLGCDPELEQLASPNGYTVVSPTVNHSTSTEIGVDGAGSQIELRPGAYTTPENIVTKIKTLIEQLPPVGIVGDRFPLGGHIHVGGIKYSREAIKLLDDFIGKLSAKTSGDARGSYKHLGAYKTKPYGFEYRSPSSTWLHNPEIARITFKLTKQLMVLGHSAEGIEYELDSLGVPSLASYEKLLTTDEAIEFISFHKNYKKEFKPINYNWGVEPVVPRVSRITFRDDWGGFAERRFRAAFKELSHDYPLYFYGLREDRGDAVGNFEVADYETVYHHPHPSESGFWFGVPLSIRRSESTTRVVRFVDHAHASISAILRENRYLSVAPVADESSIYTLGGATSSGTSAPPSERLSLTAEEMVQTINRFYGSRLTTPTDPQEETNDTVAETTE